MINKTNTRMLVINAKEKIKEGKGGHGKCWEYIILNEVLGQITMRR